jgi:hypothetical protein
MREKRGGLAEQNGGFWNQVTKDKLALLSAIGSVSSVVALAIVFLEKVSAVIQMSPQLLVWRVSLGLLSFFGAATISVFTYQWAYLAFTDDHIPKHTRTRNGGMRVALGFIQFAWMDFSLRLLGGRGCTLSPSFSETFGGVFRADHHLRSKSLVALRSSWATVAARQRCSGVVDCNMEEKCLLFWTATALDQGLHSIVVICSIGRMPRMSFSKGDLN